MCEWGDTITINIGKKPVSIDRCIAPIVFALNNAGCKTIASCCGHGKFPGNIALVDGRELLICPDYDTARQVEKIFSEIKKRK